MALPSIEQQTSSSHVLNAATLSEQMPRPCGEEEIRLEMARWNHQRRSSILQNRRSAVNVEVAQVAVLKKLAQHARAACEEEKRADAASQARTKAMGRVGPGWYQSHKGAASVSKRPLLHGIRLRRLQKRPKQRQQRQKRKHARGSRRPKLKSCRER